MLEKDYEVNLYVDGEAIKITPENVYHSNWNNWYNKYNKMIAW